MAPVVTPLHERESYLAARVLNALLREDYGGLAARLTRDRSGVTLPLPSGRRVRLTPGGLAGLFQDFVVAPGEELTLAEVLDTLGAVADPLDAEGVAAFAQECRETLVALDLLDRHAPDPGASPLRYEVLAARVDHPVYPTARCRLGLSPEQLVAYAPEFAPHFELRWAAVPRDAVTVTGSGVFWPTFAQAGLPSLDRSHVLFPVHPLAVPSLPGGIVGREEYLRVRPTLSMRTVAVDARTHLKLPLATSTLGARNRRSIKPATLRDGALAERLLREVLDREPGLRVLLADEQTYGHAGHEYLAWMIRRLPEGEIVSVAALAAPGVLAELAARHYGGDQAALLRDYLTILFTWNVTLFVRYGIALEAHQQNLALVFGEGGLRLLVKDNDGLLVAPDRSDLDIPAFADQRLYTDDPHALADLFVTITLHLAAAAIAVPALGDARWVRQTLAAALDAFGDHPMARLLRARTLDAARLVGKSMVTAGTLVDKSRTGAADVNKYYGTSGPNYLTVSQRSA
ncbi:IucA/IucC family protein [Acrocarpospora catenulata]|uniref:IucA/IucC family protein n=1 Tax=Acrocarpospora catenulata TaxID=2836182 RepID=UPI0027DFB68C|nr:IucA/IucC family protein [Acrocarpospora catenulata]